MRYFSPHQLLLLAVVLVACATPPTRAQTAEQVHLSFPGTDGCMTVQWATLAALPGSPAVEVSTSADMQGAQSVSGLQRKFHGIEMQVIYISTVELTGLAPATLYYYRPSNANQTFSFRTLPALASGAATSLLVYGDFGLNNSEALSMLIAETQSGDRDMVLHVGDIGYDFWQNAGTVGNDFMNLIEPVAAFLPYQTCPGNHEDDVLGTFQNYRNRFAMPNYAETQNMYYSFDLPLAHVVAFNGEAYFDPLYWPSIPKQYLWLEADLKAFNDKYQGAPSRPWLIMYSHRPMYCTESDDHNATVEDHDCTVDAETLRVGPEGIFGMEKLLRQYNVDLYLCGHTHEYERLWPVYNNQVFQQNCTNSVYTDPQATVHIISGAAGNREHLDGWYARQPWDSVRVSNYSYSVMDVLNETHIHWQQREAHNATVLDDLWLVRTFTSLLRW